MLVNNLNNLIDCVMDCYNILTNLLDTKTLVSEKRRVKAKEAKGDKVSYIAQKKLMKSLFSLYFSSRHMLFDRALDVIFAVTQI